MQIDDALFIFNDNEEYNQSCVRGGGNAIIRKYNKHSSLDRPRSVGIPTGTLEDGGYEKLTQKVKRIVDNSIEEIKYLLSNFKYKRLFFSSDNNGKLGTKIFVVDENVINYITKQIYSLTSQSSVYLIL